MGFSDFIGNENAITNIRQMLAHGRFPHAVIIVGAEGAGKYTLAQMIARAMNCLQPPEGLPDFCGTCANCQRIAEADALEARCAEAVEAREALRETDKKETRIFIQTHPDVLVIPSDPPQLMIKVDQVRRVTETIYFRPSNGSRRVYIFTDSAFMKEAANALLKVLEEPPEFATIFLLTSNAGELLPTIRSRAIQLTLAPLSVEQLESLIAKRQPALGAKQRGLVARLSEGAYGKAQSFDLAAYLAARTDALILLRAAKSEDHSSLFKVTETYRAGSEGKEKTTHLLHTLHSLLEDLMYLQSGTPELVRNLDIAGELERMAKTLPFRWIESASRGLNEVESGMRRNLLRSLSLDAFAVSLEQ
ncbi:MAG TPA: DNA polymerase III subunit [Terriglobales bacterium]|nr:DNA polymerase III subunit [Terriglobales bacterium]